MEGGTLDCIILNSLKLFSMKEYTYSLTFIFINKAVLKVSEDVKSSIWGDVKPPPPYQNDEKGKNISLNRDIYTETLDLSANYSIFVHIDFLFTIGQL